MSYTFTNANNTTARRSADSADVPWDPQSNQPVDISGRTGQRWIADGSPIPDPYVAPPPTADELRGIAFLADVDRQALVTQVANATPAQIKAFVNTNVTDLASAKLLLAKIILLLGMTIRS